LGEIVARGQATTGENFQQRERTFMNIYYLFFSNISKRQIDHFRSAASKTHENAVIHSDQNTPQNTPSVKYHPCEISSASPLSFLIVITYIGWCLLKLEIEFVVGR
jgi:hypothetical protein